MRTRQMRKRTRMMMGRKMRTRKKMMRRGA